MVVMATAIPQLELYAPEAGNVRPLPTLLDQELALHDSKPFLKIRSSGVLVGVGVEVPIGVTVAVLVGVKVGVLVGVFVGV